MPKGANRRYCVHSASRTRKMGYAAIAPPRHHAGGGAPPCWGDRGGAGKGELAGRVLRGRIPIPWEGPTDARPPELRPAYQDDESGNGW